MSIICPTVLADNAHIFREQMDRIAPFAERIQIDLADGDFTTQSVSPAQVWWPEHIIADIHLMYRRPTEQIETLVSLTPSLVIIHAEADGDLPGMMQHLQGLGIKAGIALLPSTSVDAAKNLIAIADHVLIFSGNLGHFGGTADLSLLAKVQPIRAIKADIEIGWDGGANETNVRELADGGVDVLNVGGGIQRAADPIEAYRHLSRLIG